MKLLASLLLIICCLTATQTFAEDVVFQPLTRADCKGSSLTWNDNANVCDLTLEEAGTKAQWDATSTAQPLTRKGCDLAGMQWNDFANVCDEKSGEETTEADAKTITVASEILIDIDKAAQKMTVSVDGEERYHWAVSTGRAGYSTPSGTFTPKSMNEIWYSKQWDNAPMPHAIFFTRKGHAIHGTNEVKQLGKPASHGCVRLSPQNASTLFTLVAVNGLQNTQVVLTGRAPGGGVKAANRSKPKSRKAKSRKPESRKSNSKKNRVTVRNDASPNDKAYARPKKRGGGFFRRRFKRR